MNIQWTDFISGLTGPFRFERDSRSWNGAQGVVAAAGEPHIETTEAGPALFIGRRTRNLLPREYAPIHGIPQDWATLRGIVPGEATALDVDSSRGPVSLKLPTLNVNPEKELLDEGSTYVGVIYLFSGYFRGKGKVTLKIRDEVHDLEVARSFDIAECEGRPCVALDGPLEPRGLTGSIVVESGAVSVHGLMLEPYVMTYRNQHTTIPYPCPGCWVPGGESRAADRLAVDVPRGTIPKSGMIDFWVKPTWEALHPNHTFFEMAHWYFGFGAESQEPLFHAGEKPCPWTYYWEWSRGQGFKANTWHHGAVTWDEDGSAVIYWDGQPHAYVQQVQAHALDPLRVGETMIIGAKKEAGMFADPNVASELDGYLRSFRLTAGHISAADVVLAMEAIDPLPGASPLPARAVFIGEGRRSELASNKEYCWFPMKLAVNGQDITVKFETGGDTHLRSNIRARGKAGGGGRWITHSKDGGTTWSAPQPTEAHGPDGVRLPDGRTLFFPFITQAMADGRSEYGEDIRRDSFNLRLVDEAGNEETIATETDMQGINEGRIPTALDQFVILNNGTYLFFGDTILPGTARSSIIVLASDDLRHWKAVAVPMRDEGHSDEGYCECKAVQHPDGRILLIARTGGFNQSLARSYSSDNGRTWTPHEPSGLCGVQPRLNVLHDGTLVVNTGRPGITTSVSTDFGLTFPTQICAEDDRIHEFVNYFGWYGYSSMNNGFLVDQSNSLFYLGYDMLGVRRDGDGTSRNACYLRTYPYQVFENYPAMVRAELAPDDQSLRKTGMWSTVPGILSLTNETGAALEGTFEGTGLVAIFETSTGAGTALVQIDDEPAQRLPLYYPRRMAQRRLLASGLAPGAHRFRIALESGSDPQHKFAHPEMPLHGGPQTAFLTGTTPVRHLAVHGIEILK